jgi:hypothetical protein
VLLDLLNAVVHENSIQDKKEKKGLVDSCMIGGSCKAARARLLASLLI